MSTSVLELPRLNKQAAIVTRHNQEFFTPDAPNSDFSTDEVHSLHRDDAMAGGAIAIILGCAFFVLLGLTIGVTVWTMNVTV